jgi:hypothetical protein
MQKIIAHRGLLNGPDRMLENNPHHVMDTIYKGFDAEIDVWHKPDGMFLGHDEPYYKIDYHFLINKHLWIHCKNYEALVYLFGNSQFNLFFHKEDIAVTTKGFLWTAPGLLLSPMSIAVMPELVKDWDIKMAYGICTDYPLEYKK